MNDKTNEKTSDKTGTATTTPQQSPKNPVQREVKVVMSENPVNIENPAPAPVAAPKVPPSTPAQKGPGLMSASTKAEIARGKQAIAHR